MPCACLDLYDWSLKFHKTWLSGLLYGWLQAWPAFPRKSFVRGGEYLWQRRTPRKWYKLFWFPRKYEEKLRCQTLEKSQVSPALFLTTDPRRPRGSQSGREKRSDESSQAQAEKPLGTDCHQTISEQSSECWLLIGHKNVLYYCAQSANSISWVLFVCSYAMAIVSPFLSGSFTKVRLI